MQLGPGVGAAAEYLQPSSPGAIAVTAPRHRDSLGVAGQTQTILVNMSAIYQQLARGDRKYHPAHGRLQESVNGGLLMGMLSAGTASGRQTFLSCPSESPLLSLSKG